MDDHPIPAAIRRQAWEIEHQRDLPDGDFGSYRLWENPASPYSAKVRAFVRYKGIPYRRMRTNLQAYFEEIPALVGTPMIPVILTPDDRVMLDSTPMLLWLDGQHPDRAVLPDDPCLSFLARLIEDFSDEYVLRFSMYYRWENEISRKTVSSRLARSLVYGIPDVDINAIRDFMVDRQTSFNVALGITDDTRADIEQQLAELLAILDEHFRHHLFLLGDRPSLGDFGLYGHFFAHLYSDPYPASILESTAPQVCNWIDRITEFGDVRGAVGQAAFGPWLNFSDNIPGTLESLLSLLAETYLPMSAGCGAASVAREKSYRANIRGIETTFGVHHYRAWAYEQIQLAYFALSRAERNQLEPLLSATGILATLTGEVHHNGLYDGRTPPFVTDGAADNRIRRLLDRKTETPER